jgi:DNA-binding winged helix-turn-helix (wHTH) protein/tetratricopeptide (TPR) repeat protein
VNQASRIDLAHAMGFRLGRLTVRPATRELVRDDGESEVLEPRVMQVLVALVQANGAIVSRDDLSHSCWEGRVVGDDAINRVISRLRRSAEGIGEGSFRLETVTKVGYRLQAGGGAAAIAAPGAAAMPRRRMLLAATGAGAIALAGGGAWLWHRHTTPKLPSAVPPLMDQAAIALLQDTHEGQNQAIALYRRVVALAPDYADGWGKLGMAYAVTARFRPSPESQMLKARADAAGQRALAIDSRNGYGLVARAGARPRRGNWLVIEHALRTAIAEHPNNADLLFALGDMLCNVGRNSESLALIEQAMKLAPPSPGYVFTHLQALWRANRLEEFDRAQAEAQALYPTHFAVWFARFYTLMFTGRAHQAIAMGEDSDTRPSGIRDADVDAVMAVARAIDTRDPKQVADVGRAEFERAHNGTGYAENAIQFESALGRLDDAFAIADALYFSRGFAIPDIRFSPEQGTYSPMSDRLTNVLFAPSARPMWRDPRFDALVRELELTRYWRESGSKPDYLTK